MFVNPFLFCNDYILKREKVFNIYECKEADACDYNDVCPELERCPLNDMTLPLYSVYLTDRVEVEEVQHECILDHE